MLDADTLIPFTLGVIAVATSLGAVFMNTRTEVIANPRKRLTAEVVFLLLAIASVALMYWQNTRSADARHQQDSLQKKFEQERRDSQAAFDRFNQDAQIERDRSQKERNGLRTSVNEFGKTLLRFVADTYRTQTLNSQKLNAQVSQNGGEKQFAELNNKPPLPTATQISEKSSIAPPVNPDQITLAAPKHLAFTALPVLASGAVVKNLYFFQSAVESTAPDKDVVLSWDFGDGKPVTSRATERVLHAFSDEHPYRPGQIQVTVIGTVPHK